MVEILSLISIFFLKDFFRFFVKFPIVSSSGAEVSTALITIAPGNFNFAWLAADILLFDCNNSTRLWPFSITVTLKYFIYNLATL